MKKLALMAGVVLAASLVAAPLAYAQDEARPTCADALTTLDEARVAHSAALAADKAAADAKKADDALADAEDALDAARAASVALNAGINDANVAEHAVNIRTALVANPSEQRKAELNRELVVATAHIDAIHAVSTAQVEAAKTDTERLRRDAAKTDVAVTSPALDKALAGYNTACTGKPGANGLSVPAHTPAPSAPAANGAPQVPVLPSVAPATGGGPAA